MSKTAKTLSVRTYEISFSLSVDIKPVLIINTHSVKIGDNSYRITEQKRFEAFLKKAKKVVPDKSEELDKILYVFNACNECKGILYTIQPFWNISGKDLYIFRFAFPSAEALKRFDDLILSVD